MENPSWSKRHKLGTVSGVYIPVCLNIFSILLFLRFGTILGQVGLLGMLGEIFLRFTQTLGAVLLTPGPRFTGGVISG